MKEVLLASEDMRPKCLSVWLSLVQGMSDFRWELSTVKDIEKKSDHVLANTCLVM